MSLWRRDRGYLYSLLWRYWDFRRCAEWCRKLLSFILVWSSKKINSLLIVLSHSGFPHRSIISFFSHFFQLKSNPFFISPFYLKFSLLLKLLLNPSFFYLSIKLSFDCIFLLKFASLLVIFRFQIKDIAVIATRSSRVNSLTWGRWSRRSTCRRGLQMNR